MLFSLAALQLEPVLVAQILDPEIIFVAAIRGCIWNSMRVRFGKTNATTHDATVCAGVIFLSLPHGGVLQQRCFVLDTLVNVPDANVQGRRRLGVLEFVHELMRLFIIARRLTGGTVGEVRAQKFHTDALWISISPMFSKIHALQRSSPRQKFAIYHFKFKIIFS